MYSLASYLYNISKTLLIDDKGEVIAVASEPSTLQTPRPLCLSGSARVVEAVSASIRSVLEKAGPARKVSRPRF